MSEDRDEYLPDQTDHLLTYLAGLFPPRCIRLKEELIEHHRYAAVSYFISELIERRKTEVETSVLSSGR